MSGETERQGQGADGWAASAGVAPERRVYPATRVPSRRWIRLRDHDGQTEEQRRLSLPSDREKTSSETRETGKEEEKEKKMTLADIEAKLEQAEERRKVRSRTVVKKIKDRNQSVISLADPESATGFFISLGF